MRTQRCHLSPAAWAGLHYTPGAGGLEPPYRPCPDTHPCMRANTPEASPHTTPTLAHSLPDTHQQLGQLPPAARARFLALRVGGPIAKLWAKERHSLLVIGDTLFIHGGISAEHLSEGCGRLLELDRGLREWLWGTPDPRKAAEFWGALGSDAAPTLPPAPHPQYSMPSLAGDDSGPFWNRHFALP